ncbi:MAG: DUF2238 domain-containing protein [Pseudonocardiaceae bacterium]|jgi:hypothetical protein
MVLHALVLIYCGRYTYANAPLGNWFRDTFALSRNDYDRLDHFVQGPRTHDHQLATIEQHPPQTDTASATQPARCGRPVARAGELRRQLDLPDALPDVVPPSAGEWVTMAYQAQVRDLIAPDQRLDSTL